MDIGQRYMNSEFAHAYYEEKINDLGGRMMIHVSEQKVDQCSLPPPGGGGDTLICQPISSACIMTPFFATDLAPNARGPNTDPRGDS